MIEYSHYNEQKIIQLRMAAEKMLKEIHNENTERLRQVRILLNTQTVQDLDEKQEKVMGLIK